MTRIAKIGLGGMAGIFLSALLLRLGLFLLITPSFLEGVLEKNLNCEVALEGVQLRILRSEIELNGLALTAKDSEADQTGLETEKLLLGVRLWPLLTRRIETTSLVIEQPVIRAVFRENGDFSLGELFKAPSQSEESEGEKSEKGNEPSAHEEEMVLPAEKNAWLAKLSEARISNGRLELAFEGEGLKLEIENLSIAVEDLRFNPEDLKSLNEAFLTLGGDAQLFDREGMLLVRTGLAGTAGGKLFEERSGEFKPDLLADLSLSEDSFLNPQVKIVRKIWNHLDQVERVGIPVGDLPKRIEFGQSRTITVHYRDGVARLQKPLSLTAGIWELGLAKDSWLQFADGKHEIGVEFLTGGKAASTLTNWMDELPTEVRRATQTRFFKSDQVLWRVNSRGKLSNPKFDFLSQVPEAEDLYKQVEDSVEEEVDRLRDQAKGLLRDLLNPKR